MAHNPLQAAAYVLEPEFRRHEHEAGGEVMRGWVTMLERLLPVDQDRAEAEDQYTDYLIQQGHFGAGKTTMWLKARSMSAWRWWMTYGG